MPDLHDFEAGPGPVWDLASPVEIRRRGDARTRRRRVASAVAGVAAAAVVATSVTALTGLPRSDDVVAGDDSRDPSSSQDDTGTRRSLADVDLTSGMRNTSLLTSPGDADRTALDGITICGSTGASSGQLRAASDVEVTSGLDASGTVVQRSLLAYPDDDTARDALLALRRAAASCSPAGSRDERMIALGIGDDPQSWSWAYAFPSGTGLGPSGAEGSLLTARVGPLVLLSQSEPDPSTDQSPEEQLSPDVLRVVRDMCDLAAESC